MEEYFYTMPPNDEEDDDESEDEVVTEVISRYMKKIGSKGGKSRMESMTKEERSKLAKKAIRTRWNKDK